jgi:hypothetical protein
VNPPDPIEADAEDRFRLLEDEARKLLEEQGETVERLLEVTPHRIVYMRPVGVATAWRHDYVTTTSKTNTGHMQKAHTVLHVEPGMPATESFFVYEEAA